MTTTIDAVQEAVATTADKPAALGVIRWEAFKDQAIEVCTIGGVSGAVVNTATTPAQFVRDHLAPDVVKVGEKFGPGYVQFIAADSGGKRKSEGAANNVGAFWCISIDVDNATPWPEIVAGARATGLRFVAHTTASHGKDTTEFNPAKYFKWCNRHGHDPNDVASVRAWLRGDRRWHPTAVDSVRLDEIVEDIDDNGEAFPCLLRIRHAPLTRARVLFFLDRAEAVDSAVWKRGYVTLLAASGLDGDMSLARTVQPVFFPRLREAGAEYLFETGGDLVANMEAIIAEADRRGIKSPTRAAPKGFGGKEQAAAPLPSIEDYRNAPSDKADEILFQRFWAKFRADINLAMAAEALGENPRLVFLTNASGEEFEAIETQCPYRTGWNGLGGHTDGDTEAGDHRPVIWIAAHDHQHSTAWASCFHSHCEDIRPWQFAWALVAGLPRSQWADFLLYPEARARFDAWESTIPANVDKVTTEAREMISKLTSAAPPHEVSRVVHLLAKLPVINRPQLLKEVAAKTGIGLGDLRAAVEESKREQAGVGAFSGGPPELAPGEIGLWTSHPEQVEATVAYLVEANKANPVLFRRTDGSVVLVVNNTSQGARIKELFPVGKILSDALGDSFGMKFIAWNAETGEVSEKLPPSYVVAALEGRLHKLDLPELEKISKVPVFSKDGVLVTEKGYNPHTRAFYDPGDFTFLDVPDVVTDADLDTATRTLLDVIRDFPFSDEISDDDPLPRRLTDAAGNYVDTDADGFPWPNWDRGEASRANACAMILQPFARAMINGPCPNYHIDKPAIGTGAGFLVDAAWIIAEGGERAEVKTLSHDNAEIKKAMTAALLESKSILFLDNIQHQVKSPDLAAALTAGTWSDRILGQSTTVNVPIRCTFIMAGNRIDFSPDMMRRNVPIYMNAGVPNPSGDIPESYYKHRMFQEYVVTNRAKLVWACHVIIKAWVQAGKPAGDAMLQSFNHYSKVMGGILEFAGITGFLGNRKKYIEARAESAQFGAAFTRRVWAKFGEDEKTASELLEACAGADLQAFGKDAEFNLDPSLELPLTGKTKAGMAQSLSKLIMADMRGATYTVDDDGTRATWTRTGSAGHYHYKLKRRAD